MGKPMKSVGEAVAVAKRAAPSSDLLCNTLLGKVYLWRHVWRSVERRPAHRLRGPAPYAAPHIYAY